MIFSKEKLKAKKRREYLKNKERYRAYNKKYAEKHKDELRVYRKAYYGRPESKARRKELYRLRIDHYKKRDREHYYRTKDRHRELQMAKRYNISVEEYRALFERQHSLCAICGNPETALDKRSGLARFLAVDHCHKTGKVRGLLCQNCNQAIGMLKENPELFDRAKNYLENAKTS